MCDILIVTGNTRPYNLRESFDGTLLATILENNNQKVEVLSFAKLWDGNYPEFCGSFTEKIIESGCRLVIFQSFVSSFLAELRIAEILKKSAPYIKNLFFGEQATNTGSKIIEYMDFVDFVYVGDLEEQITNITKYILADDSANLNKFQFLYFENKEDIEYTDSEENIADVELLPNVNLKFIKEAINKSDGYYFPLNIGRGCPYRCSYCNICTSRRRRYRVMSARKIVDSIKFYMQSGITEFDFTHDSLFVNKERVFELCKLIKQENLNIKIAAGGRIDNTPKELMDEMVSCGFNRFTFGVETGSPEMQIKINKKLDLQKAYEKFKYLREKNVYVECYFMYGFPEETEKDLAQTLNLIVDLLAVGISVSVRNCYFATGSTIYNKYYDELKYDKQNEPTLKVILGCDYEEEWIEKYKPIFGFLYNYENTVRKNYKFFGTLIRVLMDYPKTFFYLREIYGKENALNIYNDFMASNNISAEWSYDDIHSEIKKADITIPKLLDALAENKNHSVLKEIFRFEKDAKNVKQNQTLMNLYSFNYEALRNNLSLEEVCASESNLIICRIGNNIMINKI